MKALVFILINLALCFSLIAETPRYHEQHYLTELEALEISFSNANRYETTGVTLSDEQVIELSKKLGWKINESEFQLIKAFAKDNEILGYAMVLNENGKYYPITFLVAVTPEFSIKNISVMVYREKIGSNVRKKRFLKQYKGKTKDDPLMVDYDIMGISGATISSWSIASGAKKALIMLESIINDQAESNTSI
jgi:thiamine biosynthesis lipoprotein